MCVKVSLARLQLKRGKQALAEEQAAFLAEKAPEGNAGARAKAKAKAKATGSNKARATGMQWRHRCPSAPSTCQDVAEAEAGQKLMLHQMLRQS